MDEFIRCYSCGLITAPVDAVGGLCPKCQDQGGVFKFETMGGLVKGRCGTAKATPMFACDCDPEKPGMFKCDHDEGPLFASVDASVMAKREVKK